MTNPYPGNSHWPDNCEGCTLTGTYVGLDGQPIQGSISITATPDVLLDYDAFKIIVPRGKEVTLDSSGHFSIVVPATDDPDVNPLYWTYRIVENFIGGRTYSIEAPQNATVDLVTAAPVPDANGVPIVRGLPGDVGATPDLSVGTVTTLPPGQPADVDISGPVEAPVLDFSIPRGATGAKGDKGDPGDGGTFGPPDGTPSGRVPLADGVGGLDWSQPAMESVGGIARDGADAPIFTAPGGTLQVGTPEQFVPDGDDPSDPDYDWTTAANAVLAAQRILVGRYNKIYKIAGRIIVDEGQYLGGYGGSAKGTNLSSTAFKCTTATAGITVRSAGGKLVDVSCSGDGIALTNPIKVGGLGTGDAGTSPYLENVTALLAGTGGKNYWIQGAQNGVAIGCNSINSAGEGWTFSDSAAGWVLTRIESTGSLGPNLHITNCGAITFIRPTLERGLANNGPDVLIDGSVTYPTIQMYHPQFASGGSVVAGTVAGTALALTAAGDTIAQPGTLLTAQQAVQLSSIAGATGVSAATTYYVLNPTPTTFQLSATLTGTTPVDITADGTATVSVFSRCLIEHRASGYLSLDAPQFSGIDNEYAIGVYGDPAGANKFPLLVLTGQGSFTGPNLLSFLDYDTRAIIDNRGLIQGVQPFGTVPFRSPRSPAGNVARTWTAGADNYWRSLASDTHKNLLLFAETLPRFSELMDGTHRWALAAAGYDLTLSHNALNSLNLQATTGAATLQVVGTVKAATFIPLRQVVNYAADGALSIDASLGELIMVKLNGFNVTSIALPSNLQVGQKITLWFKTGATTPGTVTFPGLADGWIWDGLDANKPQLPTTSSTWCQVVVQVTDNGFLQEVSRNPSGRVSLTDAGVKTGAYTAAANQIVRTDCTASAFNITLPSAPAIGTREVVKRLDGVTANACNLVCGGSDVFNKSGGSTSLPLATANASYAVQYIAGGIWVVTSTDAGAAAALGGDLSGTLPNPTVAKIQGVAISGTPSAGQQLVASSPTAAAWGAPTITGQYLGSASTFVGLPTTDASGAAAGNGDWAFLTADVVGTGTTTAPQFPRGAYIFNGSTYSMALSLSADFIVGTTAGTIAAGDDSRIVGAAQKANNLNDLTNPAAGRTSLGLGGAAVLNVGTGAGTVAAGDDGRLSDQRAPLDVPSWAATTTYAKGQLALSPVGAYTPGAYTLLQAIAAFTTGASFSATGWTALGTLAGYNPLPPNARTPSGYYAPPFGYLTNGTLALGAANSGVIHFIPVEMTPGVTYDKLGCFTSVGQVAGTASLLVGLYGDTGRRTPDTASGPLVTATVDMTGASNATKGSGAISYVPSRVLHWAAALYVESVAPTTRATLRTVATFLRSPDVAAGGSTGYAYSAGTTGTYAALPTGAVTLADLTTPIVVVPHAS